MKEIVYATANNSKINTLREILGNEFRVFGLMDMGIGSQAEETGSNTAENALLKARFCFRRTGKSCFALDFGLFIEGLEMENQPEQNVKGVVAKSIGHEPNDGEVLSFYTKLIRELGGKTNAYWIGSMVFVSSEGESKSEIKIPKVLVDKPSPKTLSGFPMASIQIDQKYNKYESELTEEERSLSKKDTNGAIKRFVRRCLHLEE
jgi:XTP/dITP diphosphohydrolase